MDLSPGTRIVPLKGPLFEKLWLFMVPASLTAASLYGKARVIDQPGSVCPALLFHVIERLQG
jgi:hypothetical protein